MINVRFSAALGIQLIKKGENTMLEEAKFDLFCLLNNGVTIVVDLTPAANRFTIVDYHC